MPDHDPETERCRRTAKVRQFLAAFAQKNGKEWTVQKRLLSARRTSQMGVFDNEIERWGEVDVPYLPSQLIGSSSNE
ncbi:hypothetical protein J6590_040920 [Homalodisca vitripennis]|nr:hypothetical protein J6590_040920 [Homalodisca vitripennis]